MVGPRRRLMPADAELASQRQFVASLLKAGASASIAVELGAQRTVDDVLAPIPEKRVRHLYQELVREYREEGLLLSVEDRRQMQVQRIRRDLVELRSSGKKNFAAIARLEEQLAKLEGTFVPTRLQVDVEATQREALMLVVGGYDGEELERIVSEQEKLERAAELGFSLLAAGEEVKP